MFNDRFADFIPAQYSGELPLKSAQDMVFLGRENLEFLKNFWDARATKFTSMLEDTTDYYRYLQRKAEIERCEYRSMELDHLIKEAYSKPRIFEKTTFRVGSEVVCFQEKPDRYVLGEVSEVYMDPKTRNLNIVIRVFNDTNYDIIKNRPDGFTLFTLKDFEYFRTHVRFFEIYLKYYTQTVTERDKVARMLKAIVRLTKPAPIELA